MKKPAARLTPFLWGKGESWPEGRHNGAWGLAGIAAGFRPIRAATRSGTAGAGPQAYPTLTSAPAAGDNKDVTAGPGLPGALGDVTHSSKMRGRGGLRRGPVGGPARQIAAGNAAREARAQYTACIEREAHPQAEPAAERQAEASDGIEIEL